MVRDLRRIFSLNERRISPENRRRYRTIFRLIVLMHVVGLAACFVFGLWIYKLLGIEEAKGVPGIEPSIFIRIQAASFFLSLTQLIGLSLSFVILMITLKSEALVAQSFDLASNVSRCGTHTFPAFADHILWLIENHRPSQFSNPIRLVTTVSTPAYGIAAAYPTTTPPTNDERGSLKHFLDYLEMWIEHFELLPDSAIASPSWEFSCWNSTSNRDRFSFAAEPPEARHELKRFETLLSRLWILHAASRVEAKLFYTEPSDVRLFMVASGANTYSGLMVSFTPLTPSAVRNTGWSLLGVSFYDADGFQNFQKFNRSMQKTNYAARQAALNCIADWEDPRAWLMDFYGLPEDWDSGLGVKVLPP